MSAPPPGYNSNDSLIPEFKGDAGMMAMKGGGGGSSGVDTWQQSLIPAYGGDVKFEAVQGGGGNENEEKQAVAVALLANATGIPIETASVDNLPENLPKNV
ncbi:MAG: hypothetical protein EB120_13730, partial [Proteobacteria bacterium]|nr:hypothetical protein [Pseudomonadota bacterium]